MFCPNCKDEFRPGFTQCGRCQVDLVEELREIRGPAARPAPPPPLRPITMVDYCGFFTMNEAQQARAELRLGRIRSELVLREPADARWDAPANDEFWLRVDASRLDDVHALLAGGEPATDAGADDESFACSECGCALTEEQTVCPKCGARFDQG